MFLRGLLIASLILALTGCKPASQPQGKLTIGVVSFGESERSINKYSELKDYLSEELNQIIELEPTYNEIQALSQIQRQKWDIVFAPPGLAAIAISESKYLPIFALEGVEKTRSVIVVLEQSTITKLSNLAGKVIAFGQPGSASSYYLPIYNLYGLTLAEARLASTPKEILTLIAQEEVVAGAMSLADFNRYRSDFPQVRFRILYTDDHHIPSGAILLAPTVERNQQEQIRKILINVSPAIASSAGYLPNAPIPEYNYLIEVVARVRPIAARIKQKPAPLLYEQNTHN